MLALVSMSDYSELRRAAVLHGIQADAEPGTLITFRSYGERKQKRARIVEIRTPRTKFSVTVPDKLARELRTAESEASEELFRTLAKCFARAFIATVTYEDFNALHEGASVRDYEDHIREMKADRSEKLAATLAAELGEDVYQDLLAAIRHDMGLKRDCEVPLSATPPVDKIRWSQLPEQPLALFPI